jgi:HEPN domain-containing protein
LPAKCFLEAVAFELAIKIYFEIDNNKEAPHTHNLGEIFPKLSETTRKDIENFFAQEVVVKAKLMENVIGKKLYIPEFKEAISNNSEMVMNFKYRPVLPNGSLINLGFLYKIYRNLENRLKNK